MPLSRTRDYLSIGEVLDSLQSDFPDVSISKIRFLEAEGLIAPERTPSGYRKFYEGDVARLRYILTLQRDQFLPLKVIAERLAQADANGASYEIADAPGRIAPPPPSQGPPEASPDLSGVQMTRSELAAAAGLTESQVSALESFGLVEPAGDDVYEEDALAAASAARGFLELGIEPRHLRMYRQFADRQAALFEQLVTPVARRRDPSGAGRAAETVGRLVGLSRRLHDALVQSSTRPLR